MGFLDRLLGRDEPRARELTDEQALERYRHLVRTAPPERLEEAHEEAFAQLTPEQRREALRELSADAPEGEATEGDDPRSLARAATRAELRRPGTVERAFGRRGTLLGSFAAAFAGTTVASALMSEGGGGGGSDAGSADAGGGGFADGGGGDFGGGF